MKVVEPTVALISEVGAEHRELDGVLYEQADFDTEQVVEAKVKAR